MKSFKIIFAIHDYEPIACEGDDVFTKTGYTNLKGNLENIKELAQQRAVTLSKGFSNYFQVWDIIEI